MCAAYYCVGYHKVLCLHTSITWTQTSPIQALLQLYWRQFSLSYPQQCEQLKQPKIRLQQCIDSRPLTAQRIYSTHLNHRSSMWSIDQPTWRPNFDIFGGFTAAHRWACYCQSRCQTLFLFLEPSFHGRFRSTNQLSPQQQPINLQRFEYQRSSSLPLCDHLLGVRSLFRCIYNHHMLLKL